MHSLRRLFMSLMVLYKKITRTLYERILLFNLSALQNIYTNTTIIDFQRRFVLINCLPSQDISLLHFKLLYPASQRLLDKTNNEEQEHSQDLILSLLSHSELVGFV